MHELSIVQNLIELASEGAAREGSNCVRKINVRIGALAGVDYDALQFSFELASEGTACKGAVLEVGAACLPRRCARAARGRKCYIRRVCDESARSAAAPSTGC